MAFDAVNGPYSTVRVVTTRGPSLSLQVPDVRWPERQWVKLAPDPRPDFDRDGRHDVVVAIREPERTCLAWVQVNLDGFVAEVFRSNREWVTRRASSRSTRTGHGSFSRCRFPARGRPMLGFTSRFARLREVGRSTTRPRPSCTGIVKSNVASRLSKRQKSEAMRARPIGSSPSSIGSNSFAKPRSPC